VCLSQLVQPHARIQPHPRPFAADADVHPPVRRCKVWYEPWDAHGDPQRLEARCPGISSLKLCDMRRSGARRARRDGGSERAMGGTFRERKGESKRFSSRNSGGPSAWRGARCAWREARVISSHFFLGGETIYRKRSIEKPKPKTACILDFKRVL
jgi:hypothetical protein